MVNIRLPQKSPWRLISHFLKKFSVLLIQADRQSETPPPAMILMTLRTYYDLQLSRCIHSFFFSFNRNILIFTIPNLRTETTPNEIQASSGSTRCYSRAFDSYLLTMMIHFHLFLSFFFASSKVVPAFLHIPLCISLPPFQPISPIPISISCTRATDFPFTKRKTIVKDS